MAIHDSYISKKNGFTWNISYEELDSFETITHLPVGAEGAFCFYGDKMVIVYAKKRETWEIPGGGREEGETFDECILREIKEESNMRVLELIPLGYDTFTSEQSPDVFYVLRYAARVEPLGEFSGDGAEDGEVRVRLYRVADEMVQRIERGIQALEMAHDGALAVNVERRAVLGGQGAQVSVFAVEAVVLVVEQVHAGRSHRRMPWMRKLRTTFHWTPKPPAPR